jgi:hypothetical protein
MRFSAFFLSIIHHALKTSTYYDFFLPKTNLFLKAGHVRHSPEKLAACCYQTGSLTPAGSQAAVRENAS